MATDKRQAIIEAALELFAKRGYSETPTSAIAKLAGVAEGTIFHHFQSKSGILLTILEEVYSNFFRDIEPLLASAPDGLGALTSLIEFHFRFANAHSMELHVVLRDLPAALASTQRGFPQEPTSSFARVRALYRETVRRGVEDGSICPAATDATSSVVLGMVIGVLRQQVFGALAGQDLSLLKGEALTFCRNALKPGVATGG